MHGTQLKSTSWLNHAVFHHHFSLGDAQFKATLFGKPHNWSLSQLKDDHANHAEYTKRLGQALYDLQVGKALAPNVTQFTDRVIASEELALPIRAGLMTIHRNQDKGKEADGVTLAPSEAFVISTANCPVTVMECKGAVLGLHTGRNCLIDRQLVESGIPTKGRAQHSVCFNAIFTLADPSRTRVKVFWAEPPSEKTLFRLNEGAHIAFNRKLYEVVGKRWGEACVPRRGDAFHLILPRLIKAQCMELRVPEENIDLRCAHQPVRDTWLDGTPGAPRNLVVINRLS